MSERMMMTCNHCLRQFEILHCGSGDALCCECVHAKRLWLALEKRGTGQHNQYAEQSLEEHASGKRCNARGEGFALPLALIQDVEGDAILDASEVE